MNDFYNHFSGKRELYAAVLMAPLHRELLGIDPFSAEGVARQTELLSELLRLLNRD